MVLDSKPYDQDWIRDAKDVAQVWNINYDKVYEATPVKRSKFLAKLDKKDRSYLGPREPDSYRTPVKTRKGQQSCKPDLTYTANDHGDSDDEVSDRDHDFVPAQGPSTLKVILHSQGKKTSGKGVTSSGKQQQQK